MRKIKIFIVLVMLIIVSTGCVKSSVIIPKPQKPSTLTQPIIIQNQSEMKQQSPLEQEVWSKIKLLYIDIELTS